MAEPLPEGYQIESFPDRGLPAGYQIEHAPEDHQIGTLTGKVRPVGRLEAAVRGAADLPIVGPGLTWLGAAAEAAGEPLHPGREGSSQAETWRERTAENYARDLARTEQAYQDQPLAAYAGNIGSSLLGGGALLRGGGLGAKLLGYFPGQTLGRQALAMGASGAGINAADALMRGNDPRMAAVTGGAVGAVSPYAANAVGSVLNRVASWQARRALQQPALQTATQDIAARAATAPPPWPAGVRPMGPTLPVTPAPAPAGAQLIDEVGRATPEFLDHAIDQQYAGLGQAATAIAPQAITNGMKDIRNMLRLRNFDPDLQQNVYSKLGLLESRAANGAVSFQDVRAVQKALKAMRGPMQTENEAAAGFAASGIDNFLNKLHPQLDVVGGNITQNIGALKNVNADYRMHKLVDRLQLARELSQQNAQLNPANNLRNQIRVVLREQARGKLNLPPDTVALLKKAVGGYVNPMALAAKLAPRHHLSVMGEVGAGMAGFPFAGAAGAAAGQAAQALDTRRVTALFNEAIQSLLNKAPSVQLYNTFRPPNPGGTIARGVASYLPAIAAAGRLPFAGQPDYQ